jgi:hypothetical protein
MLKRVFAFCLLEFFRRELDKLTPMGRSKRAASHIMVLSQPIDGSV